MQNQKSRLRRPVKINSKSWIMLAVFAVFAIAGDFAYRNKEVLASGFEEFIAGTVNANVQHIMVEGLNYSNVDNLHQALGINRGDTLVGFNSAKVREDVESLPWVRLAAVERKLPATVNITIYEYNPLALLVDVDGAWVIDKNGHKIAPSDSRFTDFPIVSGLDAETQASSLFSLLADFSEFSHNVVEASLIGKRRWNVRFKTDVIVQLPEKNPERGLRWLSRLDKEKQILSIRGAVVDLRLEDRIVLRIPPEENFGELSL